MRVNIIFLMWLSWSGVTAQVDSFKISSGLWGLDFSQEEIAQLKKTVYDRERDFEIIRQFPIDNNIAPALYFNPLPKGIEIPADQGENIQWKLPAIDIPADKNDLAFYSILELASLIKNRKISSTDLTNFFIDRLKKYSDTLECTVTITQKLALKQALRADSLLEAGLYLGPLHGIPYGAKDLFSVPGYPTTWGAMPYKDQVLEETSDVITKLEASGAVLIAKLTLGALAMGDVWYGGVTKNPWKPDQGSSGSSAGSASATVAGLVPFAIGTETRGSIVSPATRCGATGLRPTFGRVSRAGAMALSWSMDKIGPICRSAEDCAIVFDAIRGQGRDYTAVDAAFPYRQDDEIKQLKVAYFKNLIDSSGASRAYDEAVLQTLKSMGLQLWPIEYKINLPVEAIGFILTTEAAAAFDDLTRMGNDDMLVRQLEYSWPNTFRAARFVPAVEYIQANRLRTMLIEEFHQLIKEYDVIITPSFAGTQMLTTNLTGQPIISLPNGFSDDGTPRSISFLGNLYDEHKILALAKAYQEATEFEDRHPPLFDH
ncbi:MAG: amidase [Saprospiraceae bacterium]|nr:amidase [Saprospiraceae bacterium]